MGDLPGLPGRLPLTYSAVYAVRVKKMRSVVGSALLGIVVPQQLTAQASEDVAISGVVVDAQGAPVAGARLGTGWWFDEARLSCYGSQSIWAKGAQPQRHDWRFVPTDTQGYFDARIKTKRGHIALTVFSADATLAAHQVWKAGADLEDISVQLLPVAKLHLDISCPDFGRDRTPATAYLNAVPSGTRLGRFKCDAGQADLLLPPGTYELYVYGRDMQPTRQRVTVKPGQERSEQVELRATFLAMHKGKRVPPWTADAVRGLDQIPSFETFRGKWLAVAIWSAFRSRGVGRDIPELLEFDRKWREGHPGEEPPYAIVLLHSGDTADVAELNAEIEKKGFRDEYFGGKPLPFPILLDENAQTVKDWQPRWSSDVLLFDPGGLYVDRASPELLERAATGEVPTPTPVTIAPAAKRRAPADDPDWGRLPLRERSRSLHEVLSIRREDSSESWCRSLLWNPRQIYVPPATRKRLATVIDEQFRGIAELSDRLAKVRHEEFDAAIKAKKIKLVTKADLTKAELEQFEAFQQQTGLDDSNVLGNIVPRSRKYVITRWRAGGVYGARLEDLRKTLQLTLRRRNEQITAVVNVLEEFHKAGTLTRAESKAVRGELEQMIRR